MLLLKAGVYEAESMTKEKSDTFGITAHCRQPDLVDCSERQTSYGQSGDEICLRCPVASWVTVMVVSGAGTNAEADWFEPDSLEETEAAMASIPASRLVAKAA